MTSNHPIDSFVVRFVHVSPDTAETADAQASWYGTVRHIQSDAEMRFTSWDEVAAFVGRFVALEPAHE
jgi:hypothetical protein